VATVMIECAM